MVDAEEAAPSAIAHETAVPRVEAEAVLTERFPGGASVAERGGPVGRRGLGVATWGRHLAESVAQSELGRRAVRAVIGDDAEAERWSLPSYAIRHVASATGLMDGHAALPPVLRALDADAVELRSAVRGVDPHALVHQAGEHGLSALLLHAFTRAGLELPAQNQTTLRRDAMNLGASVMRVRRLLVRAVDALAAEGVTPVLLKGPGLGERLYPEPLLRPTTDVDLLVSPSELAGASRALRGLGLSQFDDPGEDDVFGHHHHLSFSGEAGTVELHFRLTSGFGTEAGREAIAPRSYPATFERRAVKYLEPEEELVYLSIHAAQHLFLRVGWLYDLKLLVEAHPRLDTSRVVELARGSGMSGAVHAALWTARSVVGLRVPESLVVAVRPSVLNGLLSRALFTDEALASAWIARHRLPAFVARAALAEGGAEVRRQLAEGAARGARRWLRRFGGSDPKGDR